MWDLRVINELNDLASEEGCQREALRDILASGMRPRYYLPIQCPEPKPAEREDQVPA
jgi:hypothetical protein